MRSTDPPFSSAPPPSNRALARRVLAALERHHPEADTELAFTTAFELLVATILSAQCTDERVNGVTPSLFRRYPDARALAAAEPETLESLIRPTGFFRSKARSLLGMASVLVEDHAGEVPATMEALVALPGVGRKTANVVLGHAFGAPGLPVDRHVLRVSNRLGLVHSFDPVAVESELNRLFPPDRWTVVSDTFILHGRRICKPRPLCDRCHARGDCAYAAGQGSAATLARPGPRRVRRSGSPRATGTR